MRVSIDERVFFVRPEWSREKEGKASSWPFRDWQQPMDGFEIKLYWIFFILEMICGSIYSIFFNDVSFDGFRTWNKKNRLK